MGRRLKELKPYKHVWLTEQAHILLKREKVNQGKSIMRLVDDLVTEKYGSRTIQKHLAHKKGV